MKPIDLLFAAGAVLALVFYATCCFDASHTDRDGHGGSAAINHKAP